MIGLCCLYLSLDILEGSAHEIATSGDNAGTKLADSRLSPLERKSAGRTDPDKPVVPGRPSDQVSYPAQWEPGLDFNWIGLPGRSSADRISVSSFRCGKITWPSVAGSQQLREQESSLRR
jgi:hypothetical protein